MSAPRFEPGESVLLVDERGRNYLITLRPGASFHFHRGIVEHDHLVGEEDGALVRATSGEALRVFRPTLSEFILKMRRGAQVIYPKDVGMILVLADVYPGATVVEAGMGSGALTIALLRAVGPEGRVVTHELREEFADTARSNVEAFLAKAENLEIRMSSVYEGIDVAEADRVILDVPEPWRAAPHAAEALRGGGIFACFLPTIVQVQELVEHLRTDERWADPQMSETLVRTWKVDGKSVRPDHRMVAHTGFITVARRIRPL